VTTIGIFHSKFLILWVRIKMSIKKLITRKLFWKTTKKILISSLFKVLCVFSIFVKGILIQKDYLQKRDLQRSTFKNPLDSVTPLQNIQNLPYLWPTCLKYHQLFLRWVFTMVLKTFSSVWLHRRTRKSLVQYVVVLRFKSTKLLVETCKMLLSPKAFGILLCK